MTTPRLPTASAGRTWAALWAEVRRLPVLGVTALLVVLAGSASGLVAPWVLGQLVDDISRGAAEERLIPAVALIAGAAVLGGLLTGLGAVLVARMGETVLARLR